MSKPTWWNASVRSTTSAFFASAAAGDVTEGRSASRIQEVVSEPGSGSNSRITSKKGLRIRDQLPKKVPALAPALVRRIAARLETRLGTPLQNFQIFSRKDGLVLKGQTSTHYGKQLAQQLVKEISGLPVVANEIQVGLPAAGEPQPLEVNLTTLPVPLIRHRTSATTAITEENVSENEITGRQEQQLPHQPDREHKPADARQEERDNDKHNEKRAPSRIRPAWFLVLGLVATAAGLLLWALA